MEVDTMEESETRIDPDEWNEYNFYHIGSGPIPQNLPGFIRKFKKNSSGMIRVSFKYADTINSVIGLIPDKEIALISTVISLHDQLLAMPGSRVPSDRFAFLEELIQKVTNFAVDTDK